jgi:hypothetical protein
VLRRRKTADAEERRFLPWESVSKMAIILPEEESLNKSEMDRLLSGFQKFVDVFYIQTATKAPLFSDWRCFMKKDFHWSGAPSRNVAHELGVRKYDLVMNAGAHIYAASVCAVIPATFKCGRAAIFGEADFIVNVPSQETTAGWIAKALACLKMIRN